MWDQKNNGGLIIVHVGSEMGVNNKFVHVNVSIHTFNKGSFL